MNYEFFDKVLKLSQDIDDLVTKYNVGYIDACIMYSEINDVEVEWIGERLNVNKNMLAKIQEEAERLNFIKKEDKLNIL